MAEAGELRRRERGRRTREAPPPSSSRRGGLGGTGRQVSAARALGGRGRGREGRGGELGGGHCAATTRRARGSGRSGRRVLGRRPAAGGSWGLNSIVRAGPSAGAWSRLRGCNSSFPAGTPVSASSAVQLRTHRTESASCDPLPLASRFPIPIDTTASSKSPKTGTSTSKVMCAGPQNTEPCNCP